MRNWTKKKTERSHPQTELTVTTAQIQVEKVEMFVNWSIYPVLHSSAVRTSLLIDRQLLIAIFMKEAIITAEQIN